MEYRNLGRTGIKVSPLCLGAMTFGEPDEGSFMHGVATSEAESFRMMDRALDAGINFFDNADVYGNDGLAERVMGRWFAAEPGRRRRVVLATKMRFRMYEGPNGSGASRRRIMEAIDESLRRLQTDWIDLYQVHMQDMETPEEETLRALDDLVHQGKVRAIGCSNYAAYRLVQSVGLSERLGLAAYVTLQAQYSLIERQLDLEHVPACRELGLGILPWSPLAQGFLTGKITRDNPPAPNTRLAKWLSYFERMDSDRGWRILDAVRGVAQEHGATCAQVALAWLMAQPQVTSPIFGARTVAQLEDNLGALDLALDPSELEALDVASALPIPPYPYGFIQHITGGTW